MLGYKEIGEMKKEIDGRFEQYNDGLIHVDELLIALLSIVGKEVIIRKEELLQEKRQLDHTLELFEDINV